MQINIWSYLENEVFFARLLLKEAQRSDNQVSTSLAAVVKLISCLFSIVCLHTLDQFITSSSLTTLSYFYTRWLVGVLGWADHFWPTLLNDWH